VGKDKKSKAKGKEMVEGFRRSSRLEAYEDVKVADMAISRAEAKDAFIHKGVSCNPFSVLNTDDDVVIDLAKNLDVGLGSNSSEVLESLALIKSLEAARANLIFHNSKILSSHTSIDNQLLIPKGEICLEDHHFLDDNSLDLGAFDPLD
jgi:hypothetical protein